MLLFIILFIIVIVIAIIVIKNIYDSNVSPSPNPSPGPSPKPIILPQNSTYNISTTSNNFTLQCTLVQEVPAISLSISSNNATVIISLTSFSNIPTNFSIDSNNTNGIWEAYTNNNNIITNAYQGLAKVSAGVLSTNITITLINYPANTSISIDYVNITITGPWVSVGSWIPLNNLAPMIIGQEMLLLTNGTVMCHCATPDQQWALLTPDINGSYANGTWSTLPDMNIGRSLNSSQVLQSGNVYIAGGEYYNSTNPPYAEIFNPFTQIWTVGPSQPSGWNILDSNCILLSNGLVLQNSVYSIPNNSGTLLYDPSTNAYVTGGTRLNQASTDEASWLLLPDNSILIPLLYPVGNSLYLTSQRYIPSQNIWIEDATQTVWLSDPYAGECGSTYMLPNGNAIFFGSQSVTEYYKPSGNTNPGSFSTGPNIINNLGQPDAGGCALVNGKILLALSHAPYSNNAYPSSTSFYEFDYTTNSFYELTLPTSALNTISPMSVTMVQLPTGEVLVTYGHTDLYLYVPHPLYPPLSIGKPIINNISNPNNGVYTITGLMFNGISQGAYYGDDVQSYSNYPIIRVMNSNNVYYLVTSNWNLAGIQQYNIPCSCNFTIPSNVPSGTYNLYVVANGNASDPYPFSIP